MQVYNNWTRGGMKSEKVHFSRFFSIFNLKLTQEGRKEHIYLTKRQ